ncbi:MAG: response regulator [Mariprofundaceae bacterium]|nr:response regulator [Mariprofundaceae bacterium]
MIHIIDDDELILAVLVELNKSFGFDTMRFRDPLAYLSFAASGEYETPTAVFCEVMMPELNGFNLMHQVHAQHPHIRFVMISSSTQQEHAYSNEACIFLLKPIGFDQLEKIYMHLRTCNECGPNGALVNAWPDNRERFGICKRNCPFESESDA